MDDCYETSAAGLTWVICSTVDLLRCAIRVDMLINSFARLSTAKVRLQGHLRARREVLLLIKNRRVVARNVSSVDEEIGWAA